MRPRISLLLLVTLASGAFAAELQLDRLKLPPGFAITVFAQVPRARMLAFSPGGTLLVTATATGKVLALKDAQHTGKVRQVVTVLSGLTLPHGIAFHQGALYVALTDRVVRYDWNESTLRAANPQIVGRLPGDGEHYTRTIVFAGGKLYASTGSDCNDCTEADQTRAAVLAMDENGGDMRLFARGLRNAVGMAVNPKTGTVWVTDNGRDNLGDDLPPDEIDDLGRDGGDFGWPDCYGNRITDPAHRAEGAKHCPSTIPPVVEIPAHSAPLGLVFNAAAFPAEYRNNLFVAYHGSWNRSTPTGYKLVRIPLNERGEPQGAPTDFITGWLSGHDRGSVMGRPVGIAFGPDGAMYVTDDQAGVVYRVTYQK